MIEVKLEAAKIAGDTRIWRLFPGGSYKFLPVFDDKNLAFLDLPGLEFADGKLSNDPDLLARILGSKEIMKNKLEHGPAHQHSLDFNAFKNARKTSTRGRLRQAVINFYEMASQGDLVIVPSTLSDGVIRIGQFTHAPTRHSNGQYQSRYGETEIPARQVKWLAKISEHQVSHKLRKSLRTQHSFSLVERSLFSEILSFSFKNYIYGEEFSSLILNTKDDYTDRETSLLGIISQLAAIFSEEVEKGNNPDPSIRAFTKFFQDSSVEYSCFHSSDIHSEGYNWFRGAKQTAFVIALTLGTLTALHAYSNSNDVVTDLNNVKISIDLPEASDPCVPSISDATKRLLSSFDPEELWEMCKRANEASERAGLEPAITVTQKQ